LSFYKRFSTTVTASISRLQRYGNLLEFQYNIKPQNCFSIYSKEMLNPSQLLAYEQQFLSF